MAVLLAHLLKWHSQPARRSASWARTIKHQREAIAIHLKKVPSLRPTLADTDWCSLVWADALALAERETGLDDLPERWTWSVEDVLTEGWLPEQS